MIQKLLYRIYLDTLTNPDTNKLSRKSLTMFMAFINMIALSWFELLVNMPIIQPYCGVKVPEYIVSLFAALSFGQGALTVWDKKK